MPKQQGMYNLPIYFSFNSINLFDFLSPHTTVAILHPCHHSDSHLSLPRLLVFFFFYLPLTTSRSKLAVGTTMRKITPGILLINKTLCIQKGFCIFLLLLIFRLTAAFRRRHLVPLTVSPLPLFKFSFSFSS